MTSEGVENEAKSGVAGHQVSIAQHPRAAKLADCLRGQVAHADGGARCKYHDVAGLQRLQGSLSKSFDPVGEDAVPHRLPTRLRPESGC